MIYTINDRKINLSIEGPTIIGKNKNELEKDDNLIANTSFSTRGYGIFPLFSPMEYSKFKKGCFNLLRECFRKAGLEIDKSFLFENYHHAIENNYAQHLGVIEQTKLREINEFPVGIEQLEKVISSICNVPLKVENPHTGEKVFHFRIIRPLVTDHNPLHKDIWQDENRDAVNLYIPLVGSNELSSLIVAPGSHLWTEDILERTKNGAVIDNVKFNVPGLTASKKDLQLERANPKENEVLIFTPYMLHGGAINLNQDTTRISVEVRLWRDLF